MSVINIKNVSKTFNEGNKIIKALDNISIRINKGEIFGLLGVNGAGKTTLISILCGVLAKDKGSISILGMDLDKDLQKIKPRTNIISGFTMLDTEMNIKEYLKYFGLLYSVKNLDRKIEKLIDLLELREKEYKYISELSSGFKQRVLMAKALINDPEIIYMDEPTVGLDVDISKKIRKIILELKKKGTTIIFTSHNLVEVEELCERIVLIKKGKIIAQGTIKDIKKSINNNNMIEVLCEKPKELAKILSELKSIENIKIINNAVIIKTKKSKDIEIIMKKAINSNQIINSIRKIEPTLEETFIDIVGEKK